MSIYIPSVDAAAEIIADAYRSEDFEKLVEVSNYLNDQRVSARIAGDANAFHNASVDLVRIGFYDYAYSLLSVGHARYKSNTDIIADMLAYGMQCRSVEELVPVFDDLIKVTDKRLWGWRAYQFGYDYLMERYRAALSQSEDAASIEEAIESWLVEFKAGADSFEDQSDAEKAYIAEYDYKFLRGDREGALGALECATEALPGKCAQCALKYASYLFDSGDYGGAAKYAGIAVAVQETRSSINRGYAYFILAMSREAIVRGSGGVLTDEKVRPVYEAYNAAIINMPQGRGTLVNEIRKKVRSLEYESNVSSGIEFEDGSTLMQAIARFAESQSVDD